MVHSKHTATLKRCLKVPQPDIRYYTLKIIKGQVPYYHRKWRQSNMRVITAIYLYVKPGLRDEWLSQNADVEGDGEGGLAVERAVRGLSFWYNVRRYPDEMGMVQRTDDGLDVDALGEELRGLKLAGDEIDPNDDDVNVIDLGAPPSPPPELDTNTDVTAISSTAAAAEAETSQKDNTTTSTSTTTASANHKHKRSPSTTSTTSTSSSSSSRLSTHLPDFFTQELERMDLLKDEKTGFWSTPTPYSPYAEHVRALQQQEREMMMQAQFQRGDGLMRAGGGEERMGISTSAKGGSGSAASGRNEAGSGEGAESQYSRIASARGSSGRDGRGSGSAGNAGSVGTTAPVV